MQIITKAKKSCVAYELTPIKNAKRGRPSKKGDSVKLQELFARKKDAFKSAEILVYDTKEILSH